MKKPLTFDKSGSQIAKGVAILWLLLYHLFGEKDIVDSMGVIYAPLSWDALTVISAFGKISVAVFVVITAYGISSEIMRTEITAMEAYKKAFKRCFKLAVNFFIVYLSVIAVMGRHFDLQRLYGEFPQGIIRMLTDALGLAESLKTPTLNMTWWYMDLAYRLIFLVPLGAYLTKKIGYGILPLVFFVPVIVSTSSTDSLYLFSAAIGIAASYGDWINKLTAVKLHVSVKWLIGILGTVLAVLFRINPVVAESYIAEADAVIAVFIIWVAIDLLASVPILRECLYFLGKNSMNIFMVHTFFYLIVYRDFVFSFKYAGLIYLALLISSTLYSVILEYIKRFFIVGYTKVIKKEKVNE